MSTKKLQVFGLKGEKGTGIKSITQTTVATEDKGKNVVNIALDDGSSYNVEIQNGSKGSIDNIDTTLSVEGVAAESKTTGSKFYELERDKSPAIVQKVSGKTIVAKDSSDNPLHGLKLFGKTEQRTTTGKNLLPYPYNNTTKTMAGVDFKDIGDGGITLSGTPTGYAEFLLYDGVNRFEGKTLCGILGTYSNVELVVGLYDENDSRIIYISTFPKNNVVIDFNDYPACSRIMMGLKRSENDIAVSGTIYPIIVSGEIMPAEYEPYTGGEPSPSVNYPQELESKGAESGQIESSVYGENMAPPFTVGISIDDATGTIKTANTQATTDFIPIRTDETYIWSNIVYSLFSCVYFYNENGEYLGRSNAGIYKTRIISVSLLKANITNIGGIPSFIRLWQGENATLTGTINLVAAQLPMLNVGSIPEAYKPYSHQSLITPVADGLPGLPLGATIPEAIANSEAHMSGVYWDDKEAQYYIGDTVDEETGKHVQRVYTKVCDGSESWAFYFSESVGNLFYINTNDNIGIPTMLQYGTLMCTHYQQRYKQNNSISSQNGAGYSIWITDNNYTNTDDFKAMLAEQYTNGTPLTIQYIIGSPIETDLTADEITAYQALHSNYPTTTVMNDCDAHMEVEYVADTSNYITQNYVPLSKYNELEERILSLETAIASTV